MEHSNIPGNRRLPVVDVKIVGSGSDERGAYLRVTATTNASNVVPRMDSTVLIYGTVGTSEIKVVRVHRDTQTEQLTWKLHLPQSPETPNKDTLDFIDRFITTNDGISVRFCAESPCGQSPQPVEIKIRGINSRFVRQVDVRIPFTVLWRRKLTLKYEFQNPLDTPLTLYHYKADVYISPERIKILQIEHTYDPPFEVPAKGSVWSQVVQANLVEIPYVAFRLITRHKIVETDISSFTLCVNNFRLENLKFSLKAVPFRVGV